MAPMHVEKLVWGVKMAQCCPVHTLPPFNNDQILKINHDLNYKVQLVVDSFQYSDRFFNILKVQRIHEDFPKPSLLKLSDNITFRVVSFT